MLYATTTPWRHRTLALMLGLLFGGLASLSLLYIVQLSNFDPNSSPQSHLTRAAIYFLSMTLGINVTLTTLTVLRLVWHHRRISALFGRHHGKVYMRVIYMCLESASLVVFIDVLCILFFVTSGGLGSAIPYESLIHFYVIAPLFIIHRVAAGKAIGSSDGKTDDPEHNTVVNEAITRGRHHLTTLAFSHSVSVVVHEESETEHPNAITVVQLFVR